MRPPRSNAWRPHISGTAGGSDRPAARSPRFSRPAATAHPLTSPHPPPFATLHPHLVHMLHQAGAHLLIPGPLNRGEITRHLLVLILLALEHLGPAGVHPIHQLAHAVRVGRQDRKSTRLNSSHMSISYAVFCLKKKKK